MNPPAIEIRGLSKRYHDFQLGPLDRTVPAGSIYGLVGPNGAGKSATMDLLYGLGAPDAGSIRIDGMDLQSREREIKLRTAYVSPYLDYSTWGTAKSLGRFLARMYPTWDPQEFQRLLEKFDLDSDRYLSWFSLGEKMRFGIVAALAWGPTIVILDEPTIGLDPVCKRDLFSELLAVVREENRTILISSHQLSDLERFADYAAFLQKGRLVLEGSISQLLERFQWIDFNAEDGFPFSKLAGLYLFSSAGSRHRAIHDQRVCPSSAIENLGGSQIAGGRVSLDDLFSAVMKGGPA